MRDLVWICGANGMLGRALERVIKTAGHEVVLTDLDVDIADEAQVTHFLREKKPQRLINCAAYTAVDKAESEEAKAVRVNVDGPRVLAKACRDAGVHALHISTDYVFDGKKEGAYVEDDKTAPLSTYGRTKRDGERAFLEYKPGALIRTSWLFGPDGKCFPSTMLDLMRDREELRVVEDQRGRPTYTVDLAKVIEAISSKNLQGIFHFANSEAVSWHGFASAIRDEALERGHSLKVKAIHPIPTTAYPTPATRPANSVLDTTKIENTLGFKPRSWRDTLRDYFDALQSR
jgi:dTDP-4-dehydrorhamnose reductase